MSTIKFLIVLIAAATLAACGSDATVRPIAYKTATIGFKAISSAHSAPLQVISMTVKLPQGATITDVSKAVTGSAGQLNADTLSYSAVDNTVSFSLTGASIKLGPTFANLKCNIPQDSTLDANSFISLNKPKFPFLEMYGVASGNSVDLVPEITLDMEVKLQ